MQPAGKQLSILDGAEGILQIHLTGPDGLDLGPEELDAGLKALEDEVFVKGLAVLRDLFDPGLTGHASASLPESPLP